jgi:hypothetical protein
MAWSIEGSDEFQEWFAGLTDAERISVARKIDLLEQLAQISAGRMWTTSKAPTTRT